MAPFATMILAGPALLLEGTGVINWFQTHHSIFSSLIIIFSSGILAFCLNFSIFYVIHSTTAVTFNVAGNLKVVFRFSLLLSSLYLVFDLTISRSVLLCCSEYHTFSGLYLNTTTSSHSWVYRKRIAYIKLSTLYWIGQVLYFILQSFVIFITILTYLFTTILSGHCSII